MINISALKNFTLVKKCSQGTVITVDSASAEMYIVLKGEVGMFLNYLTPGRQIISTVGGGDFFGETALFLGKNTPVTAVALTDIIALPINRSGIMDFYKDEPEMAFELMKAMCGRLDGIGTAYEKLSGRPWAQPKPAAKAAPAAKPQPAAAAAPAATPQLAAAAASPVLSQQSALFPEGHGSYQLPLNNEDNLHLMEKSYNCPLCRKEFRNLKVRTSKLMVEGTDKDMRSRYKGVEPLYYDVVTCPHCLYSALVDVFNSPDFLKADMSELQALKPATKIILGVQMDTFSVFAGYYLALICAPKCFSAHHLATAKLLLKLSRLYQDCDDKLMEDKTAKRALDAYMYIYVHEDSDLAQDQQLCVILGELYLKQNDIKNARDFYFKAKTNKEGSPLLKTQAENRLLDIREMEVKA